jgi:hypothetical protein
MAILKSINKNDYKLILHVASNMIWTRSSGNLREKAGTFFVRQVVRFILSHIISALINPLPCDTGLRKPFWLSCLPYATYISKRYWLCSVSTCSCSHSTTLTLNVMTYFINKAFPFYFFNIMCLLQALCVCRKVCQLLPALESSVYKFFFEATLWNSNENRALLFDIWMEVCPQALNLCFFLLLNMHHFIACSSNLLIFCGVSRCFVLHLKAFHIIMRYETLQARGPG